MGQSNVVLGSARIVWILMAPIDAVATPVTDASGGVGVTHGRLVAPNPFRCRAVCSSAIEFPEHG